ncbi:MAG: hypothetical protein FWG66_05030 [Spirochaetes bacterium]|nr:hypothetical protein [Spirochaetota bacterium]
MSGMLDGDAILKKRLYLFFVLDSSGSMAGSNIQAVNTACKEALESEELRNAGGAAAEIYVNVLIFSNGCKWMTSEPVPIDEFIWRNLDANGGTDLGLACRELGKKLTQEEFLQSSGGLAPPVIMLMSDGAPTDDFDTGLAMLQQNRFYKQFIKVACAVAGANEDTLVRFTGNKEAVIRVHTPEELAKWIKVVSLVTSKVGSQTNAQHDTAQEEATERLQREYKDALDEDLNPDDYD